MITFLLIANCQGKLRFSNHYNYLKCEDRYLLECEIIRKCLARKENQCSIFDHRDIKIVYRHYGNLVVVAGVTSDENELAIYEFIQLLMETLDTYFEKVTEMHILFNLEKVHMILQEMVINGKITGTSIKRNLASVYALDTLSIKQRFP